MSQSPCVLPKSQLGCPMEPNALISMCNDTNLKDVLEMPTSNKSHIYILLSSEPLRTYASSLENAERSLYSV